MKKHGFTIAVAAAAAAVSGHTAKATHGDSILRIPEATASQDLVRSPRNASDGRSRRVKSKRIRMCDITSEIAASAILSFCGEHGDLVTNLKLQRLLYYVEGWHLALYDSPLFPEVFLATSVGPLEPVSFARFSGYGTSPILAGSPNVMVPKKVVDHIADVMEAYGSLSSYDLERLSKDEEPWKVARSNGPESIISKHLMQHYYKLKLHGQTQ